MRHFRIVGLWSLGFLAALGCGDDDGGTDGGSDSSTDSGSDTRTPDGTLGDTTPGTLELVQTDPADLAAGVPTDVVVTAEFGSALNEATVTTSSFGLFRADGASVLGSVSVAGSTASFTPSGPLELLGSYSATLTTTIGDVSGQTLEADHTWGFRARDGEWGEPVLIEISNAGSAGGVEVATDSSGNAVAAWLQSDGTVDRVWANRFTPSAGWGVAELIGTGTGNISANPSLAVDPAGNATVAWPESNSTIARVWVNRFTAGAGWGEAEVITPSDSEGGRSPQVAVDAAGNAIVVWVQFDEGTSIWANRFTPAAGWGIPEPIETEAAHANPPEVAVDPAGNAIAIWTHRDGANQNIWSNRFTIADGWGTAELIERTDGVAQDLQVVLDAEGNAIAIWQQTPGEASIWSNRFTVAAGWGAAEVIETGAEDASDPRLAVDPNGNAIAVWRQAHAESAGAVARTNRFTTTEGWGDVELLASDGARSSAPRVALDANGNGVAVWMQRSEDSLQDLFAKRFTSTGGWGEAILIESIDTGPAAPPSVAAGPNGRAVAVWPHSNDTRRDIWANWFD